MALIYDFDRTLSPKDMQEFHYIPSLGYDDPGDFWAECAENTKKNNIDGILSYMQLMVSKNPSVTREDLLKEGEYIELYKGVDSWFDRIDSYGKEHGIEVEHYVISSGIKEIIEGTCIADKFKKIYACSYTYDQNGKAVWPSRVVNYTAKTQYLFRINKGVLDERNDYDLNRSTPDEEKYIPFENIVYFGDGLTDVPSMKVVQQQGGSTIAVFGDTNQKKKIAMELYEDKRATFVAQADYSAGSLIEKIVMRMIDCIEDRNHLDSLK